MRKRKNKTNLGIYSPPDSGANYTEEGVQKNDGVEKTQSSLSAEDSTQEGKRKNKTRIGRR